MKAESIPIGDRLIAQEAELDRQFAGRTATLASRDASTQAIGATLAALRASHLKYHLLTRDLLTPTQLQRYPELRGYSPGRTHDPARPRSCSPWQSITPRAPWVSRQHIMTHTRRGLHRVASSAFAGGAPAHLGDHCRDGQTGQCTGARFGIAISTLDGTHAEKGRAKLAARCVRQRMRQGTPEFVVHPQIQCAGVGGLIGMPVALAAVSGSFACATIGGCRG